MCGAFEYLPSQKFCVLVAHEDARASKQTGKWGDAITCKKGYNLPFPNNIDGGGWKLVRHVPAGNRWHPAKDHLRGTEEYGTASAVSAGRSSSKPWSIKFENEPFDEFLFATGDGRKWLIARKDAVTGEFYTNQLRDIRMSSIRGEPYKARWYNREGNREDPWISVSDHGPAIGADDLVYGENSFKWSSHVRVLLRHAGADVYIRKAANHGGGGGQSTANNQAQYSKVGTNAMCTDATGTDWNTGIEVGPAGVTQNGVGSRTNQANMEACEAKCNSIAACNGIVFWDNGDCRTYVACTNLKHQDASEYLSSTAWKKE
jgi:hypothetical protein